MLPMERNGSAHVVLRLRTTGNLVGFSRACKAGTNGRGVASLWPDPLGPQCGGMGAPGDVIHRRAFRQGSIW